MKRTVRPGRLLVAIATCVQLSTPAISQTSRPAVAVMPLGEIDPALVLFVSRSLPTILGIRLLGR